MSHISPSIVTYDEESTAKYHATLRTVRYDLRKTGHTIDSRASTGNLESLADLLPSIGNVDDPSLPSFHLPAPLFSEALIPDNETNGLIKSLSQVLTIKDLQVLADETVASTSRTTEYLELPLLCSNNAQDFEAFHRNNSPGSRPNPIHTSVLPCEPVDEVEDGAMGFPRHAFETLARWKKQIAGETIEPTEEDLVCEAEALHIEHGHESTHRLIMDGLERFQGLKRALTPPIPPLDEVEGPQSLHLEQAKSEVFVLSDPISLLDDDLKMATRAVLEAESPPETTRVTMPSTPPEPEALPSTLPSYVRMCDLMREPPLMSDTAPVVSDQPDAYWPSIPLGSLQDLVKQYSSVTQIQSGNESRPEEGHESPRDISPEDEELELLLHQSTEEVLHQLEQDKPDPIDSITRLSVPELDFSIPKPVWANARCSNQVFELIRHCWATALPAWPRNREEEKLLTWTPFSSKVAKVNLTESVGDYEELSNNLAISSPQPLEEEPRWGAFCLNILQLADDAMISVESWVDEESHAVQAPCLPPSKILPGPPADDILELVKKRKSDKQRSDEGYLPNKRFCKYLNPVNHMGSLLLTENEPNALTKMLSTHLALQKSSYATPTTSAFFSPPDTQAVPPREQLNQRPASDTAKARLTSLEPVPGPAIKPLDMPVRFFISATIPRQLIYGFQKHLIAGVDMLDRDFSAPNRRMSSLDTGPHQNDTSSLSYEADITVSPSTGILITTLLKIRQKPLPGTDVAVSPLRKRINNVALLYERLVIIVWQDGKDDITARAPLSPGEAAAYSDFVKQNAILQGTKIEPVYVGGGPGHLVARTIAKVRQYISCDVQHLLKEEETEWEVFFRQAGMNIYAAQVLIASLRKNFGDQGLERFLQMPLVEKMERFQGLLGGSVVLGRVSASLEKR